MRFQLMGTSLVPQPIVITCPRGEFIFSPEQYLSLGYTRYDIICIGAGGGYSDTFEYPGGQAVFKASGGGGGGSHRISGVMALLPESVSVYTGRPGRNGDTKIEFAELRSGGDGEASYFGDLCYASGGKGGTPTESGSLDRLDSSGVARGGDGGSGGSRIAGGGGLGGGKGFGASGANGNWIAGIGRGGGGGAGSITTPGFIEETVEVQGGAGGYGQYPSDVEVTISDTPSFGGPGGGGAGARITPFTGVGGSVDRYGEGRSLLKDQTLGSEHAWGRVVIRLT